MVPGGAKVIYDLDIAYLLQCFCFLVFLLIPVILLALFVAAFEGACYLLVFFLMFGVAALPGGYLICSRQAKSLFKGAIVQG
jgi:hypothetical protein